MLSYLRYFLDRQNYEAIANAGAEFFAINSKTDIKKFQLCSFNEIWRDAYTNVPFYSNWKERHNLPDKVESLSELQQWPILTKNEIRENIKLVVRDVKPTSYVVTSGSTGVPLSLPTWERKGSKTNQWLGRAANGLLPGKKTFLIWGHHHLYGVGVARIKNRLLRWVKDFILGYKRISAYDTSVEAMVKAYKAYSCFKPEFVVGYSSSILAFVRCNRNDDLRWRPRLILCTAGPLSANEKNEIRSFFEAPLAMEYGSVECGVMAHTLDDCSHYNVFWNTHILQGVTDSSGYVRNVVTCLDSRYFPLIRYDIGDLLEIASEEDQSSILHIKEIVGRPSEVITLADGTSFFAMVAEACVEHIDGIISHQIVVSNDSLELLITASRQWTEIDFSKVRSNLYAVVPSLSNVNLSIKQVDSLYRNPGGKTPIVYRK